MFAKLVKFEFLPANHDAALLLFRVLMAGSLFLKHGVEKVVTFQQMSEHFPALMGLSPTASLFCAMISDAICTILIMLGLFTRWAALYSFGTIFVAWSLVHHFIFFPKPAGGHGELIVVYLAGLLMLVVGGPGRYSLDALINRSK